MKETKLRYELGEESKDAEGRTVLALIGDPIPAGAKFLAYGVDHGAVKPTIVITVELPD